MRAKFTAALVAALAMASPALAASPPLASWEIAGQFRGNCPTVPGANYWVYGTKPAINGSFFPLTVPFVQTPFLQRGCSQSAGPSFPLVGQNTSSLKNTYSTPPVTVAARGMILHPGPAGELAVVRFIAPASGQYTISGRFYGIDGNGTQTTTNPVIECNGTTIWTGTIDLPSNVTAASFTSLTVQLLAGDQLDFEVGFGANGNNLFDATGLHGVIERSGASTGARC